MGQPAASLDGGARGNRNRSQTTAWCTDLHCTIGLKPSTQGRGTALVSAGDPRPNLIVYLPIPPNQGSTCSVLARIRSRTIIRTAALKMRRTRGEVSDAPACMPQTLQHFMMKVILGPGGRNEERALDPTSRILKRGALVRAQRRYRPKSQQFAETFGSGCPLMLLQPTRTAAASCDATVRASARCPSCKN